MVRWTNGVQKGDSLFLGRYPQTEDGTPEPIEWQVLAAEEERILVLSRYLLDARPFHHESTAIRWEDCSLRSWLNTQFINAAFTAQEQEAICAPEPQEDPAGDILWQLFGMETTTSTIGDRVFLLSVADIQLYYPGQSELFCPGASSEYTPYAARLELAPCWWLRSSMAEWNMANIVSPVNSVGASLIAPDNCQGVRPAMWLHRSACSRLANPAECADESKALRTVGHAETKEPDDCQRNSAGSAPAQEDRNGPEIADYAFSGNTDLTTFVVPDGTTRIGAFAFHQCKNLTHIEIPQSVTSIGEFAFYGCASLTFIEIPEHVTDIGQSAFAHCSRLTDIHISQKNPCYRAFNSMLLSKDGSVLHAWPAANGYAILPTSVKRIGDYAFNDCHTLTSIVIPAGVTSIGEHAFWDCKALSSVVMAQGLTIIGKKAFDGCTSLTSVSLPGSVTHIGDDAFKGVPHIIYDGPAQSANHWGAKRRSRG